MLEEERKYEVDAAFTLPDLSECVPDGGRLIVRPALRLRGTYYDTIDLRLARAGASLRFRRSDDEPWTIKLPTSAAGIRNEVSLAGPAATVPQRLLDLATVYTRGAPVAPVVVLNTIRQAYQLCDRDDRVAVEVVDDTVTVQEGRRAKLRFREIEVERKAGRAALLDRVEIALRDVGAVASGFTPKYVRAMGLPALEPPDWPGVPGRLPEPATAADVVTAAIRRSVARIVAHDPQVRLRASPGKDDTAVHQMRDGCRRLNSDLRTFAPLVAADWVAGLQPELAWIAEALGGAWDAEVLRARLRQTAEADPLVPLDETAVVRMDADLAARHEDAMQAVEKAMCDERYHRLLDRLLDAATAPPLTESADQPAEHVLPGLVVAAWRRFAFGGNGDEGAGQLIPTSPNGSWDTVRRNGTQARYAIEAAAAVLGEAAELARALDAVNGLLREQRDATAAAEVWLAIANADPDDHALAVTAGRLYERERTAVRAARESFPSAWRAASTRRLTEWMS